LKNCSDARARHPLRAPGERRQISIGKVTYVATWKGFVHVAFVIDAYPR
jgi:hypothetical protein